MKWIIPMVLLAAQLSFVQSAVHCAGGTPEAGAGSCVKWVGRLSNVHRNGDAGPTIKLATLADRPGLCAIGPLAGLRGEITVLDGVPYIAKIRNGAIRIDRDFNVDAPFLVYAEVARWKPVPIEQPIPSMAELERWVRSAAVDAGVYGRTPVFPFKIETSNSDIDFHVISNTDPGYRIVKPHRELMKFFQLKSKPLVLLGFFSENHEGVFTHRGQWTHIHAVEGDGVSSGHVDALSIRPGSVLYLPDAP